MSRNGTRADKFAACPYYHYQRADRCVICCDGICDGGTAQHHFPNGAAMRKQFLQECCAVKPGACIWRAALDIKFK